ncbi:MAG: hypothetical protein LBU12_05905 [Deltaproteobacteria bacterium]|nr:hypothetical protein [Deltaproteobacteria bacterium]
MKKLLWLLASVVLSSTAAPDAFFGALSGAAWAAPHEDVGAPPQLEAWRRWILHERPELACPVGQNERLCVWPVELTLRLTDEGGEFEGQWEVRARSNIRLPGGREAWPEALVGVLDDGPETPVPVLDAGHPAARLNPGRHRLKGRWRWRAMPETLTLPVGPLTTVFVNGEEMAFPSFDEASDQGAARLWLRTPVAPVDPAAAQPRRSEEDQLTVKIDRLIVDSQPIVVATRVRLLVSGQAREVLLRDLPLEGSRPIFLDSPLPARLTAEGLQVQVQPGVFDLFVEAIFSGPVDNLGPVSPLYAPEHWVFEQQPLLRQAQVSGAPQIDPSQSETPWPGLPIYLMEAGASLYLETLRRGDPEPGPDQLTLDRRCWLDYDGEGLSCRDQLSGQLRRQWSLTVDQPFSLSQASLGDQPQVVTWQTNSRGEKAPGLQLRQGRLNLTADLRLDDFEGVFPASGWDSHLTAAAQSVELPPGYRLVSVSGARAVTPYYGAPASWRDRWNVLDMFIVLGAALSAWRLLGPRTALLAAAALILAYHEFMAPRLVFLHLAGAAALLRVLPPASRARLAAKIWLAAASVALIVFTLAFMADQARIALHPQLESPSSDAAGGLGYPVSRAFTSWRSQARQAREMAGWAMDSAYDENAQQDEGVQSSELDMAQPPSPSRVAARGAARKAKGGLARQNSLVMQSPEAKAQNSTPRPNWSWRTIELDFSGPVAREQTVRLRLLGPRLSTALCVLRLALMVWLLTSIWRQRGRIQGPRGSQAVPASSPAGSSADRSSSREADPQPAPNSPDARPAPDGRTAADASDAAKTPNAPPAAALRRPKSSPALSPVVWAAAVALALFFGAPARADQDELSSPSVESPTADAGQFTGFPPQALLDELTRRLEQPSQTPRPSWPELTVIPGPGTLRLELKVEAGREDAIFLPVLDPNVFQPTKAALSTGTPLPLASFRGADRVALIPEGFSTVVYEGRLKDVEAFQISFGRAAPRRVVLAGEAGWRASGLDANGAPSSLAVHLTKERAAAPAGSSAPADAGAGQNGQAAAASTEGSAKDSAGSLDASPAGPSTPGRPAAGSSSIEPFFNVERVLSLGLVWKIYTVVEPLRPLSGPVTLTVPLIPGERPVTASLTVRDGQAVLNFSPGRGRLEWESDLAADLERPVKLTAGQGPYSEAWSLDASAIWRVETSGLVPIHNVSASGFWSPQWRPWPGESLSVQVSRPEPVPGAYLVSDSASLTIEPGEENRRSRLTFSVRTSQGAPHVFLLPPGAEIQSLTLDGQSLPVSSSQGGPKGSEAPAAVLPLNPGAHEVSVAWLEPTPLTSWTRSPALDLGLPTANIEINLRLPDDRWTIKTFGPLMGPAVRFWARAGAFLIVSLLLARLRLTPLRTLSWLLLFLGLSQLSEIGALVTAGWLLALGLRGRGRPAVGPRLFNFIQFLLCLWTVAALGLIYSSLQHALLEAPSMRVAGNGSTDHELRWFVDRAVGAWPQATVLTIPDKIYHYVMLSWALWLASSLIVRWLRWGWQCFSQGGFWQKSPATRRKALFPGPSSPSGGPGGRRPPPEGQA